MLLHNLKIGDYFKPVDWRKITYLFKIIEIHFNKIECQLLFPYFLKEFMLLGGMRVTQVRLCKICKDSKKVDACECWV